MSYKTGFFKMFKGSLKKFKKYNSIAWRNRWLFNLKAGDYVLCCDGKPYQIKTISVRPLFIMKSGDMRAIRSINISFYGHDIHYDPYYCVAPLPQNQGNSK